MAAALRPLGSSGLSIPPLIFGGNVFGWTLDKAASFAMLDAYVDRGGVMIDTADSYSQWVPGNKGGESEAIIGEWLKVSGKRDSVLIATKVGLLKGPHGEKLQPAHIAWSADRSLERLGIETIDLYYGHRDDAGTPLVETMAAFDALVKAGKVRAVGASNYTADRLAAGLKASDDNGLVRYSVLEPHYNLIVRDEYEGALQDLCVAEDIGAVPYFALASGFLTGKYREAGDGGGDRQASALQYLDDRGRAVLAAMDRVSAESGASLAAIALAWLAAKPGVVAPIASATSPRQLDGLFEAVDLTLTVDQIAALDAAGA